MSERDPARFYTGILPAPMDWQITLTEHGKSSPLPPCNDVYDHSPDGFSWGYPGSGPAQTALAILCDAIGSRWAMPLYHNFMRQRIVPLDQDSGWTMTHADVVAWVVAWVEAQ